MRSYQDERTDVQSAAAAFSAVELNERTIHRRAVEAIMWGIPMVNYDLMFQSMLEDAGGKVNEILYWSDLCDWKNQYNSYPEPRHHLLHALL